MKHLDEYIPNYIKEDYIKMQRGVPVTSNKALQAILIVENVRNGNIK